jgi:hypothetical protein
VQFSFPLLIPEEYRTVPVPGSGLVPGWLPVVLGAGLFFGPLIYVSRRIVASQMEKRYTAAVPAPLFRDIGERPVAAATTHEKLGQLASDDGFVIELGRGILHLDSAIHSREAGRSDSSGAGNVRIWIVNDRFMIHDLSTRTKLKINGALTRWAFLNEGDEIELANTRLRFSRRGRVAMTGRPTFELEGT